MGKRAEAEQRWRDSDDPESGSGFQRMTILEHLDELRRRLIRAIAAVGLIFLATYAIHEQLFELVAKPLTQHLPQEGRLVYLKLQEPFILYIKVAIVSAIFLAAPYILYQIWLFIAPGLYRHEKKYAIPFILFSSTLFLAGCSFAYFIAFPNACAFFIELGNPYTPNIAIDMFFDLAMFIILGMGAVFQLPLIIVFLALMGVVTPRFLVQKFRHAILIIFIIAAIISPTTDAVNLFLFAGPMILLYIISIGLCWLIARRRDKQREESAAG
jgi:sec-independent protein translocase protein TatC